MNAQTRKAQQTLRQRAIYTRKQARNTRAHATVLSGRPLPVAVAMAVAGYDAADISRNTSAISKKLGAADEMGKTRKRLTAKSPNRVNKGGRNRRMRTFPVKRYNAARVLGLLRTHRPLAEEVAARFEQVANSPKFRALALALAA
ncbi:hypothetical protein LN042_22885 [Kitasatospora sp. RB6PN24]|uniref:hypothetical protein n=1 Tax=Kitasatospora humi TaxID=2893891 RepID=UPI001E604B6C|nr:hypothetical protein [Kitasatospora humi]MCC9309881.1 hypothetical protein [Kitasatospora humi]